MSRWMIVVLAGVISASGGCKGPKSTAQLREEAAWHVERGRYEQAADAYQQVIDRKPEDPLAHRGLGQAALALDDPLRARRHLAVAYQQSAYDSNLMFEVGRDLAEAIGRTGDVQAMTVFLRDAAESGGGVRDYLLWGDLAAKYGDPDSAELAYRTAIRIQTRRTAEPYLRLARFYESLGKTEAATMRLRQAYWIEPKNAQVIEGLERYYAVVGPSLALSPEQ